MFSLEISDYQDTDAKEKTYGFLVDYSFTSAAFVIRIFLEEIELVVAEN